LAALAAARGEPLALGAAQDREQLMRLQRQPFDARTAVNRFGNNVNQAVAALHATGAQPEWAVPDGHWLRQGVRVISRTCSRSGRASGR
jgi:hypothetical protein